MNIKHPEVVKMFELVESDQQQVQSEFFNIATKNSKDCKFLTEFMKVVDYLIGRYFFQFKGMLSFHERVTKVLSEIEAESIREAAAQSFSTGDTPLFGKRMARRMNVTLVEDRFFFNEPFPSSESCRKAIKKIISSFKNTLKKSSEELAENIARFDVAIFTTKVAPKDSEIKDAQKTFKWHQDLVEIERNNSHVPLFTQITYLSNKKDKWKGGDLELAKDDGSNKKTVESTYLSSYIFSNLGYIHQVPKPESTTGKVEERIVVVCAPILKYRLTEEEMYFKLTRSLDIRDGLKDPLKNRILEKKEKKNSKK